MRRKISNIISVVYTLIKFIIMKCFYFSALKFGVIERFSPNVTIEIERKSKLIIGNKARAYSGVKIKVRNGAICEIGDNTSFNYNSILVCRKKVQIGRNVEIAPSVLIYDHDRDFRNEAGLSANKYFCDDIIIGNNVWIGANTVILRGTRIGDNSVVAAGSVIKGCYPANSLIVQKRNTDTIKIQQA